MPTSTRPSSQSKVSRAGTWGKTDDHLQFPVFQALFMKRRLIVGISGATGIICGIRLLEALREASVETHLIVSKAAEVTRTYETDLSSQDLRNLADISYPIGDIGAPIASGSFRTMGMIIAPCSIKTMSELANGITSNLLTRAGDVVLKERRRLVLLLRESPLTTIHIRNMLTPSESGAVIAPVD
jgi:flavin prenyltransferase